MKGAHHEVKLQGRAQQDMTQVKVLLEGEIVHSDKARDDLSYGSKSAKGPGERG